MVEEQKIEVSSQKSDSRGPKFDVRSSKLETRGLGTLNFERGTWNLSFICYLLFVICYLMLSGCDHRVDIDPLLAPVTGTTPGDTSYAEINPPWFGFGAPRAIIVGNDNLIYVADYDRNE